MKTLINKRNPQIRIIAPEILENTYLDGKYGVPYCDFDNDSCMMYLSKNLWTLVEEESLADQVQDIIDTSDLTNEQKVNLLQDLSGYYMKKAHYETK